VKLPVGDFASYIILKGEKLCEGEGTKICDCIIFVDDGCLLICLIELKHKNMHASEIQEKISNSVTKALKMLDGCKDSGTIFKIYPILLFENIQRSEYKKIEKIKFNINGKNYNILAQRCRSPLKEIIAKF
jgi:hypothetical protein